MIPKSLQTEAYCSHYNTMMMEIADLFGDKVHICKDGYLKNKKMNTKSSINEYK